MSFYPTRRFGTLLVTGALITLLAGCATAPPAGPETLVQEKANARWKLLIEGKLDEAYGYLAPSVRGVLSADTYKAELSGPVKWVSGEIVSVKCEAEKCDARVRLEAKPILGVRLGSNVGNIVTYFDEPWLKEEGQWWYFQK